MMTPKRIAALRKRLGMTGAEFAEYLGIDRITVWRWEAGKAKPGRFTVRELVRLEKALP